MSTSQATESARGREGEGARDSRLARVAAASLLLLVLGSGLVWFFRAHPLPRFAVTFVAPDTERVFSTISPYGRGLERDLAERFCARYGLAVRWLKVRTPQEAWQALLEGRAQVMVASGWPADMAGEEAAGEEAAKGRVRAGPAYESHRPLLLSHQRRPLDLLRPDVCNNAVTLPPAPQLVASLKAHGWERDCRTAYELLPSMSLKEVLAEENEQSTRPYLLADPSNYRLLAPLFPRIRAAATLERPVERRWFWRTDVHMLDKRMRAFFRRIRLSGTLADLQERYTGFLPEEETAGQVAHLRRVLRLRLPEYREAILRAARRWDLDPLLLVAVIYQESAFDPEAVSHTGVQGLMQLTAETAERFGVADRTDPYQSIHHGARYLKRIWLRLEPLGLTHWNHWFLTLASYNQGIGHLFDAMLLARRQGQDPRSWRNVRTALLLLEKREYWKDAAYGYTRGGEGVEYVNRVRLWYYVLKGWTSFPGLELKELAPLRLALPAFGG
jgi:membrane-bound lytic murein transglycosylase F